MPGKSGCELYAMMLKKKRSAHSAQGGGFIEPDEAMVIDPIRQRRTLDDLVNQRQPSIRERDRLRAAAKLPGRDRWRCFRDDPRVFVNDACGVAEIDEAQPLVPAVCNGRLDERHPVLLIPPRPLERENAPVSKTVLPVDTFVDAR